MKKIKKHLQLLMCLSIFMIVTTTANASSDETTINGENTGNMTVIGDLRPKSSEPEEEIEEEKPEKKEEIKITVPSSTNDNNNNLPKTGAETDFLLMLIGLSLIGGSVIVITRNRETN